MSAPLPRAHAHCNLVGTMSINNMLHLPRLPQPRPTGRKILSLHPGKPRSRDESTHARSPRDGKQSTFALPCHPRPYVGRNKTNPFTPPQ